MLSKENIMASALIIYLSARNSWYFDPIEEDNIYGLFSKTSAYGMTSKQLGKWYRNGKQLFELQPGFKADKKSKMYASIFEERIDIELKDATKDDLAEFYEEFPKRIKYFRMGHWGSLELHIDPDEPLWKLTDAEYEEYCTSERQDEERDTAPEGILVSQLTQVLDWDEMWNDTDFTISSKGVYYRDNGNTDRLLTRSNQVLDINTALKHYDLPILSEFLLPDEERRGDKVDTPIFNSFVQEYLSIATIDPRTLRGVGYSDLD